MPIVARYTLTPMAPRSANGQEGEQRIERAFRRLVNAANAAGAAARIEGFLLQGPHAKGHMRQGAHEGSNDLKVIRFLQLERRLVMRLALRSSGKACGGLGEDGRGEAGRGGGVGGGGQSLGE